MRLGIIAIILALFACKQSSGAPVPSASAAPEELVPASVGRPCKLVNQRKAGDMVGVFREIDDLTNALTDRAWANEQGVAAAAGKAVAVPDGTRCTILATEARMAGNFKRLEFRKVETAGVTGWVQRAWAVELPE